jgi:uncharacterized protein
MSPAELGGAAGGGGWGRGGVGIAGAGAFLRATERFAGLAGFGAGAFGCFAGLAAGRDGLALAGLAAFGGAVSAIALACLRACLAAFLACFKALRASLNLALAWRACFRAASTRCSASTALVIRARAFSLTSAFVILAVFIILPQMGRLGDGATLRPEPAQCCIGHQFVASVFLGASPGLLHFLRALAAQVCEKYGSMFSLQKLLGKEDKFFTLLEASAEEARGSVQALVKLSKDLDKLVLTDDFAYARRKDREITKQISDAVYTTFITALEREDIEELSNALYKIPKMIEKFTERLLLAPHFVRGIDFSKQISLLERATDIVLELVKSLRGGMNLERVKDLNDKLQFLEGEADKHMMVLYKDLFSGKHDPVQVIALKDLYEMLEKVIDRCRDAGNVISHIVLKNS